MHLNHSTTTLYYLLDDKQAEANASAILLCGAMHLAKLIEYVWLIFLRDSLARIFDTDLQALSRLLKYNFKGDLTYACKLQCVLDQVNEYLEQASLIA